MNIVTLTLNPAFDIHCLGDNFEIKKESFFDITSKDAGGKGINVSRALSAFGIKSTAFIVVGSNNKDEYLSQLKDSNISIIDYCVNGSIRENITLHHNSNEETRISFRGFTISNSDQNAINQKIVSLCNDNTILTIAGSLPVGYSKDCLINLLISLRESGTKIIIDSKSFVIDDIIKIHPYLIKPNMDELATYTNTAISTKNEALEQLLKLKGISDYVLLSLGSMGAVLMANDNIYLCDAEEITPISTIGAGDSMIAGFISQINSNPEDKLKYAVAFGTAACLTKGTTPPSKIDINKLL